MPVLCQGQQVQVALAQKQQRLPWALPCLHKWQGQGESPAKPRSRSLGRLGEVDSFVHSDPLADASTSFSSGYLTAEYSISPGIPEAESYNVIDQLGDASPSFSSSSSWSKSCSARHLGGAEKDRILGVPTRRSGIVRAPAPPASWITRACFSGSQVAGAYTVPVPDGACQNLGASTNSRGPSSPRDGMGWSSVPVSTAKGSKTCQASVASTPGLPLTGMVVQDRDCALEPPENPFENTKQIPWNCRWTLPTHMTRHSADIWRACRSWMFLGARIKLNGLRKADVSILDTDQSCKCIGPNVLSKQVRASVL
eukprot:s26_g60.t1